MEWGKPRLTVAEDAPCGGSQYTSRESFMLVPTSGGSDRHSTEHQASALKENGERNEVLSRKSSQEGNLPRYVTGWPLACLQRQLQALSPRERAC